MAETKIVLDILAGNRGERFRALAKKRSQIRLVRSYSVAGEATGNGEILQKAMQQVE
jgi:hypothetical protein